MSLHFFHTELAFIGIGIPIGPTDGQVQEGAGLQLSHVSTLWLERRNHSTHFSASSTHSFPQNTQAGAGATGNLVPSVLEQCMPTEEQGLLNPPMGLMAWALAWVWCWNTSCHEAGEDCWEQSFSQAHQAYPSKALNKENQKHLTLFRTLPSFSSAPETEQRPMSMAHLCLTAEARDIDRGSHPNQREGSVVQSLFRTESTLWVS